MSRRSFSLIACLVLVFSFVVAQFTAFAEENGTREDAKRVKVKLRKDTHKIDFNLQVE
jgi:hypothetical protein